MIPSSVGSAGRLTWPQPWQPVWDRLAGVGRASDGVARRRSGWSAPADRRRSQAVLCLTRRGPELPSEPRPFRNVLWTLWLLFGLVGLSLAVGCRENAVRSQSPEDIEAAKAEEVELVGDVAVPFGLQPMTVEGVALVTNLPGTGSDAPPSPQRELLISEMRKRGINNPNQILNSGTTAMVTVRGYIRPGAQEGDRFDVEVRVPPGTETKSLRGGYLLETKLRDYAVLGGMIREGHILGVVEGPIMVEPDAKGDKFSALRGKVLGGARNLKTRQLALVLKPKHQNISTSAQVGRAIQTRFQTYEGGIQKGAANPKTNEYVDLKVHSRYKHNLPRYLQVVRMIPLRENASQRIARLPVLERKLLDPISSARAALQLEALGTESIDTLKKGLKSESVEVRFYSAEALAYLGERDCAYGLAELAKQEAAFRIYALTALASLDEVTAYDALRELVDSASSETRYGAFRALWKMDPDDPFIRGETLGEQFSYHVIDTIGPNLIHATASFRPEIVVFGRDQRLRTPCLLEAGPRIVVTSKVRGKVQVHKLSLNEPEQQREVTDRLDDVLRAVVEVGGGYPDVVQMLTQAKTQALLEGKFEIDALPEAGRTLGGRSDSWANPPLFPEDKKDKAKNKDKDEGKNEPPLDDSIPDATFAGGKSKKSDASFAGLVGGVDKSSSSSPSSSSSFPSSEDDFDPESGEVPEWAKEAAEKAEAADDSLDEELSSSSSSSKKKGGVDDELGSKKGRGESVAAKPKRSRTFDGEAMDAESDEKVDAKKSSSKKGVDDDSDSDKKGSAKSKKSSGDGSGASFLRSLNPFQGWR